MGYRRFPATRFQGSKLKLLPWLESQFGKIEFDSCLDGFGGTSAVAYLLKSMGKQVTVNDQLRASATTARALVENGGTSLEPEIIDRLQQPVAGRCYDHFIAESFADIFFLDEENRWLDRVVQNIDGLLGGFQRDLALHALFQACLAKRPYNLFHRANLYMRTAEVERSFGNKATWERPFTELFVEALSAANGAVFDNGRSNRVVQGDLLDVSGRFDLVYLDPPYMNARGQSVDYRDFYHFLEGLTEYGHWGERIDLRYKHRPYQRVRSPWLDKNGVLGAFEAVFERFSDSIFVVSYRDNGIPTPQQLAELMRRFKRRVICVELSDYQYALSKTRSKELLFVGCENQMQ